MKRVLVQAGHKLPLQPGFEGGTGAVGEAELVAKIQTALLRRLDRDERFEGIGVPGHIPAGLDVDAALFLHADAASPAASGYSVSYPQFKVNQRLADLVADEIAKIPGAPGRRADNPTDDAAQYYGYGIVDTAGPEVLVEHGFMTNVSDRAWLSKNVNALADAEMNALRRFFGFDGGSNGNGHVTRRIEIDTGTAVTVDSALIAPPRASQATVTAFMLGRDHGAYTEHEVRSIVRRYFRNCLRVGLDPLLAVAQMAEETAHLTSFWSQAPRRNFAGLGVTGEPGVGLSFGDLKSAVRAHTGRLAAYAIRQTTETPAQLTLIEQALAFRPLPEHLRGAAPTLRGLAGTWAADPDYAKKVAGVANQIRNG